jgi:(E)-4-hydroxy-3-methylbut-2-enyl-diphosphate synthase
MGKDNSIFKTLKRRKTRVVKIGNIFIGGTNSIAIQAMTKIKTSLVEEVLGQIKELKKEGAQIIRLSIKDNADALAIKEIKKYVDLPLVADIHFDANLAIKAIENGIDKIRLNPGNLRDTNKIKKIVELAKKNKIPIRVGLNSGSLRGIKPKFSQGDIVKLLLKEAVDYLKILERFDFYDIVVSLKTSDVSTTIQAYKKMAELCDYPFHLGLTATGSFLRGVVSSSIALATLLSEGIGDTVRVSLTGPAVEEVKVAKYILETLGLKSFDYQIISCPTCGRCEVNLVEIVKELENRLNTQYLILDTGPLKIAIMGCVVNGPGEAKEADLGIAFGKKDGLLFKKGKPYKKVNAKNCLNILLEEIKRFN